MKCAMPHCGADSAETAASLDEMNTSCMGRGCSSPVTGEWCIAAWLRSWSDVYPKYEDFILARPWETSRPWQ